MDRTGWKPFLERWSEEWRLVNPAEEPDADPWLGFPPASPEQVEALERRLGCALPPSFREFLLVTNGWRDAGDFVWRLRDTDEIGWMRDLDPFMADLYDGMDDYAGEGAVLSRPLLISLEADAGVVFLDPGDVDERGEWAAYDMFSWTASGPQRHDSFYEKMYDFYAGFHALNRPRCATQREWDAKVEQARLASLAGEVDEPLTVLKEASRFGRDRATFLLFQMSAIWGSADASNEFEHLLGRDHRSWTLDEDLFTQEILPFLFAQHERDRCRGGRSIVARLMEHGSGRVRQLIADHRRRAAEPGFQVRFGNPDFDTAVRAVLSAPGHDDAWPLLREALPTWRPLGDDHLVPIALLADPRTARLITPERGREILATRRS
ncbi:SMI1/KNR4 family protein [Streptosporangium longisporum]|uniref:Knr4/Smi1-like domain-containing protein n=1 Tax=Streptosporangium longisporum TaxID=46187 RepID=A0ABN3Y593_9ACTN